MKTVDVIRRENLHILAKEAGGPGGLAEDLGKSKSQISQWLNASPDSKTGKPRTIGNASAREIEQKKNKPTGWMDVDRSPAPASGQTGGAIGETSAQGGLERGDESPAELKDLPPEVVSLMRLIESSARGGELTEDMAKALASIVTSSKKST